MIVACGKTIFPVQGGTNMAQPLVSDELWSIIEPHIPVKPRRTRNPGRKPVPNRACLAGILFVLKSGIPWEMLPQEMGCGSGMTCWRRLRDWKEAGVWQTIHEILLNKLRAADAIDFDRALVDSGTVRAFGGAKAPAPAPWTAENPGPNTTC
jgi:transposase